MESVLLSKDRQAGLVGSSGLVPLFLWRVRKGCAMSAGNFYGHGMIPMSNGADL